MYIPIPVGSLLVGKIKTQVKNTQFFNISLTYSDPQLANGLKT